MRKHELTKSGSYSLSIIYYFYISVETIFFL